ncbi:hypothetical protein INT45_004310 [Circinella minor]|uniref:FAD-binding domain-containing protein n=1 Tax=Circinella minor TaxID=1195481 RepID=A0A8H7SEZ9_9FUNG|nr:hypothetical protein INT45_004310 [Circinella minor]
MDDTQKVDVFISGAGPVGLLFALRMKANNHTFYIADIKEEPTYEMRAVSLTARTMETLQNFKLAHHILQEALVLQGTQLIVNGKKMNNNNNNNKKLKNKRGQIDMAGDTSFPHVTSIAQHNTEKIFSQLLGEEMINRHTELVSYKQRNEEYGVEAIVKDLHTGKIKTIHAKYIIGADGTHSGVRKLIKDWTYDGFSIATRFGVGDVSIEEKDAEIISRTRGSVFINGDVLGGFVPVGEQENGLFYYRFFVNLGPYEVEMEDAKNRAVTHGINYNDSITLEQVQDLVNQGMHPLKIKIKKLQHLSVFRINERKANGYRRNCAFLIGDAAHCHSPAGGQGLNLGLQDAGNLAWKLSLVLNGFASDPEKVLDSYAAEREPIVAKLMQATGSSTRLRILRSGLAEPGDFMPETVALRKRIINNQHIERQALHTILQQEGCQHSVIWIATRPSRFDPCEWTREFWCKYFTHFGSPKKNNAAAVRPIIIESTVHATQCKAPIYVCKNVNNNKNDIEHVFWTEEQWDVQNSISKRVGLDKYMWNKSEPPAAIVIVRPDLYVAYTGLVRSAGDMDQAFEFLGSYLISKK